MITQWCQRRTAENQMCLVEFDPVVWNLTDMCIQRLQSDGKPNLIQLLEGVAGIEVRLRLMYA